jgi:shikimate kinase
LIALVGMPGSGKSTVGRHLARHLGWRFVDSDAEIEHQLGQSIRAYFEQFGEDAFREVETAVVGQLALQAGVVLATGGGAVLRPANREALKRGGQVVYLRATPEDLFRRLRHDRQRPLLQVGNPLAKLRELYRARDPLYAEVADFTIDTGRSSVPTIVNLLSMQMELAGALPPAGGAPHHEG